MKKIYMFACILFCAGTAKSQISFTKIGGITSTVLKAGDIQPGDFDNDGDMDFIIAGHYIVNFHEYSVTVQYVNDGAGNFSEASIQSIDSIGTTMMTSADIDNDGDLDVLIAGKDINSMYVSLIYKNDGKGVFSKTSNNITGIIQGDADFGDIDGDSDMDLFITGYSQSGYIADLYMNDGTGIFVPAIGSSFRGGNYANTSFLDIDGDSDLDLIVSGQDGSNYFTDLYSNNGSGIFSPVSGTSIDGVAYGDIDISDIDKDGDMDIVISGYNGVSESTKLYLNDGSGAYSESAGSVFPAISNSRVEFADVDLDNDNDLLLSGYDRTAGQGITILYENNGKGEFSAIDSTTIKANRAFPNKFIDVDGDNDPDLIVCEREISGDDSLTLYRNNHCSTPITAKDTRTECAPYVWIDGKSYSASNNSAKWTLSSSGGCDSVVTLNLTISTVDTSVAVSGETLTANASGASYQWIDCGNANAKIDGATSQAYTATKSGSYAVAVTQNGCTDTSSCFAVTITGINNPAGPQKISVYPTATRGTVHINMGEKTGKFSVIVTDVSGRKISQNFYSYKENVDVNLMAEPGIYLLTVTTQDQKVTFRVVKE